MKKAKKLNKKAIALRYENRVIEEAQLIASEGLTVREVAKRTGHCKTGVHNDCTDLLKTLQRINPEYKDLYKAVRKVMKANKADCTRRGGEATKAKYQMMHA